MKTEDEIRIVIANLHKIADGPRPSFWKDYRPKKKAQAEILEWVLE